MPSLPLLGSGFQRRTSPFLWVPELSPDSVTSIQQQHLTATQPQQSSNSLILRWLIATESELETKLLCDWRSTANQFVFGSSPLKLTTRDFAAIVLTKHLLWRRGWVCRLQLLVVLDKAVILRSESCGTNEQILLSQIRDSPNLECEVPVFISPRNRVARLYLKHWVPFSSPPATRRTTVDVRVFDSSSTR
jgi:hypothetical protein